MYTFFFQKRLDCAPLIHSRTWAPGVRFGHQNLRKQRPSMEHWVVIPGGALGSPGLVLGCSWASWACLELSGSSLAAPDCFWAAPGASELEPREVAKMTLIMTDLGAQI